jgi:hypothetical protein
MPTLSSTTDPSRIMMVSSKSQYQLSLPSVQDQISVLAVLHALGDRMRECASGLPSMIQDGLIGGG